jgi:tetratricopeptide (TPR) repeat protein
MRRLTLKVGTVMCAVLLLCAPALGADGNPVSPILPVSPEWRRSALQRCLTVALLASKPHRRLSASEKATMIAEVVRWLDLHKLLDDEARLGLLAMALDVLDHGATRGDEREGYEAVAQQLARARQPSAALGALGRIPDRIGRELAVQRIATTLAEVGDVDAALKAIPPSRGRADGGRDLALSVAAQRRARDRDREGAVAIVQTIDAPETRARTLGESAKALREAGDAEGARALLDSALAAARPLGPTEPGVLEPPVLARLAVLFAEAGDGVRARSAIADLKQKRPSGEAPDDLWFALVEAATERAKAGDAANARVAIDVALDEWSRLGPYGAPNSSYKVGRTAIAKTLVALGELDRALAFASAPGKSEERAEAIAEVIDALVASGRSADALPIAIAMPESDRRTYRLEAVTRALAEAGLRDAARSGARAISKVEVRDSAILAVLFADVKADDISAARLLLDALTTARARDSGLAAIASQQEAQGDLAAALRTTASISEAAARAWALVALGLARHARGDHASARDLVLQADKATAGLTSSSAAIAALQQLAKAQRDVLGDPAAGRAALTRAASLAAQYTEHGTDYVRRYVAEDLADTGDVGAAQTLLETIKEPSARIEAFVSAARVRTDAGDQRGAKILLARAVAELHRLPSADLRWRISEVATGLAGLQQRSGDGVSGVCDVPVAASPTAAGTAMVRTAAVAEAAHCAATPTTRCVLELVAPSAQIEGDSAVERMRLVLGVTRLRLAAGDRTGAKELVALVQSSGSWSAPLSAGSPDQSGAMSRVMLALSQAEVGDVAAALASADTLPSDTAQALVLAAIARAQIAAGDADAGREHLWLATQMAPPAEAGVWTQIALAHAAAGDFPAAIRAAIRIAPRGVTNPEGAAALGEIAALQAKAGDRGAAEAIVELVAKADRERVQVPLGRALAETGHIEDAMTLADHLASADGRQAVTRAIGLAQLARGQHKEALAIAERTNDAWLQRQAAVALASAPAARGNLAAALAKAKSLRDAVARSEAFLVIGMTFVRAGQSNQARESFARAATAADAIAEPADQARLLGAVARGQFLARAPGASRTLALAIAALQRIEGRDGRTVWAEVREPLALVLGAVVAQQGTVTR